MNQEEQATMAKIRSGLRAGLSHYIQASERFNQTAVYLKREQREVVEKSIATSIQTFNDLIEEFSVKMEGKEPLNESEEMAYDNLNKHLRLSNSDFESLTDAQRFSAARVIIQQGCGVNQAFLSDHLGIRFTHIYIGIEADGYAHS